MLFRPQNIDAQVSDLLQAIGGAIIRCVLTQQDSVQNLMQERSVVFWAAHQAVEQKREVLFALNKVGIGICIDFWVVSDEPNDLRQNALRIHCEQSGIRGRVLSVPDDSSQSFKYATRRAPHIRQVVRVGINSHQHHSADPFQGLALGRHVPLERLCKRETDFWDDVLGNEASPQKLIWRQKPSKLAVPSQLHDLLSGNKSHFATEYIGLGFRFLEDTKQVTLVVIDHTQERTDDSSEMGLEVRRSGVFVVGEQTMQNCGHELDDGAAKCCTFFNGLDRATIPLSFCHGDIPFRFDERHKIAQQIAHFTLEGFGMTRENLRETHGTGRSLRQAIIK
mmetsp:Transcript_21742/g.53654  ORF Transcript_21742/g.53654 Transcript_21742/m.53654 type:complete len:336 (+) Transcript_21742:794-1801(+)